MQDEKGDRQSLPARENGVVEKNTFLQRLPKTSPGDVDCGIVVPTYLRMLTLVLPTSECMCRYHNPHLQGLFTNKYPENGFGYVQPREDLRDCIVLPDFR